MGRSFIHSVRWKLPEQFVEPMKKIKSAVHELKLAAGHSHLGFTLDGRLIGDLGEAIAQHFFMIELCDSLKAGHDAVLTDGNKKWSVEVKMRRCSTGIWFDSEPDYLLVFRLEPGDKSITLVYAGAGSAIMAIKGLDSGACSKEMASPQGATIRPFKSRHTVSLNQLAKHFDYAKFMSKPSIPFRNVPVLEDPCALEQLP